MLYLSMREGENITTGDGVAHLLRTWSFSHPPPPPPAWITTRSHRKLLQWHPCGHEALLNAVITQYQRRWRWYSVKTSLRSCVQLTLRPDCNRDMIRTAHRDLIHWYHHVRGWWADYPANKTHVYNIYTTSAQRLRRWSNIVSMLYKWFVFAGYFFASYATHCINMT